MLIRTLREAGFASRHSLSILQRHVTDKASLEILCRPPCLPFAYASAISKGAAAPANETRAVAVKQVARDSFLVVRNFPQTVFAQLPLAPHCVQVPDEYFVTALRAAFAFLREYYEEGFEFASQYLRLLVLVDIDGHSQSGNGALLTSCSLPALPFCGFLSRKSLVHLPPLHIATTPDTAVLAENLFHEALHNALNLDILARRVFRADFRATASPRVAIPWRANASDEHNRIWPVDRVLHALFVYVGLVGMRLHLLRAKVLDGSRRDFLVETLPTAAYAMIHLAQALQDAEDCFTANGLASVRALRSTALGTAAKLARFA